MQFPAQLSPRRSTRRAAGSTRSSRSTRWSLALSPTSTCSVWAISSTRPVKKMSKSLGNVIDPWEVLNDPRRRPLRWWMFSQGSPWTSTRASLGPSTPRYARRSPSSGTPSVSSRPTRAQRVRPARPVHPAARESHAIDQWILSRLEASPRGDPALDGYEPLGGAAALAALIDDLSNWYVRLQPPTFLAHGSARAALDALAAQATLLDVLQRVTFLLAPFCPFITERLYQELYAVSDNDSVHLVDWPSGNPRGVTRRSRTLMAVARRLTSLGRCGASRSGHEGAPTPGAGAGVLPAELAVAAGGHRRGRAQRGRPRVRARIRRRADLRTRAELQRRGPAPRRSGQGAQAARSPRSTRSPPRQPWSRAAACAWSFRVAPSTWTRRRWSCA